MEIGIERTANDDRSTLLDILREQGVLYSGSHVRLTGRDGTTAAWMLYAWPVTTTPGGLRLAARELVGLLGSFEATQIVGYGTAGTYLVAACLSVSDDRYTGLVVRPEQKKYGANRQIDPEGDRRRKVVIVDDSMSSGTSFFRAAQILERAGYEVEGALCLVDFSGRGGRERAQARGYRVESVFNMWADIKDPGGQRPAAYLEWIPDVWSLAQVPEDSHPAIVARRVTEHFLRTGEVLRPPEALAHDEDGRGGVWVSFRRRSDDTRVARHGFWHFEPADSDPRRDVVLATVAALRQFKPALAIEDLPGLKIAVSFFGPLERVPPGDLDFHQYGIVVRSEAFPYKLGGALPNTQLYTSTAEQYRHAREVNARIGSLEPHVIFRHTVDKRAEPGETWPSYGERATITDGWTERRGLGEGLVGRASEIVEALISGRAPTEPPFDETLLPLMPFLVGVSLYDQGLVGRFVASGKTIDEAILRAARSAVGDLRFATHRASRILPAAVGVSLLHDPESLGTRTSRYAAWRFRAGRDSLVVRQGDRRAVVLESDLCHNSWTKAQTAQVLLEKAGITAEAASWTTYKTSTWMSCRGGTTHRMESGSARREPAPLGPDDVSSIGEHLYRRLDANGWPAYGVSAALGRYHRRGGAPRCIQGLHALSEVAAFCNQERWQVASRQGLSFAVGQLQPDTHSLRIPDHGCGPMADACLLHAVSAVGNESLVHAVKGLAARLRSWIRSDGCVVSEGAFRSSTDVDFLPGVALLALAKYAQRVDFDLDIDWEAIRTWHRRRFELLQTWGTALWHGLVWPAVFGRSRDQADSQFALDLADWICAQQLRSDGTFFTDLHPTGQSFHVACAARVVATGWQLAVETGDPQRAGRYQDVWHRAMTFMNHLVVRREDTFWMPESPMIIGGVREAVTTYEMRIDQSGYTALSLLAGLRASQPQGSVPSGPKAIGGINLSTSL